MLCLLGNEILKLRDQLDKEQNQCLVLERAATEHKTEQNRAKERIEELNDHIQLIMSSEQKLRQQLNTKLNLITELKCQLSVKKVTTGRVVSPHKSKSSPQRRNHTTRDKEIKSTWGNIKKTLPKTNLY